MKVINYTSARNNLMKTMQRVCEDHSPILITRKNNSSVVVLSLEDYESLNETVYLFRSPKNAKRLLESVDELKGGKGKERDLLT